MEPGLLGAPPSHAVAMETPALLSVVLSMSSSSLAKLTRPFQSLCAFLLQSAKSLDHSATHPRLISSFLSAKRDTPIGIQLLVQVAFQKLEGDGGGGA